MQYIDISEFTNHSENDILEYLKKKKSNNFEVEIEREAFLFNNENHDIARDFLFGAYAGQKLASATDKFEYSQIGPADGENFYFTIENADHTKLAEALYHISLGYGNEDEEENTLIYNEAVEEFLGNVEEGIIKPVCQDFIDTYFEYFKEDDENDDDN